MGSIAEVGIKFRPCFTLEEVDKILSVPKIDFLRKKVDLGIILWGYYSPRTGEIGTIDPRVVGTEDYSEVVVPE